MAETAVLAQFLVTDRAQELGMVTPAPAYWLVAGAWALLVTGVGLALATGVRRLAEAGRRSLATAGQRSLASSGRRIPRPLVLVLLAGVVVTTAAAAAPTDLLGPLRKTLDPHHVLLSESPLGATHAFAQLDEAPTPEDGAEVAVDRLVADGGLEREAIIIALPTGSGWVNRAAITDFEAQFDGDVAVVSAQYGDLPSWWSFLLDREPAMRSAQALVDQVLARVGALPAAERPDVFVHGESLGALAGQAAVSGADPDAVCGVIWSGAPGGERSGHPRERSLLNPDDPVGHLSAATALREPADWPGPWIPGLSYGTTVLDLGASLDPEPGHGHNYGVEQDWTLPSC